MSAVNRRRLEVGAAAGALGVSLIFMLWLVLHVGGETSVVYFDDVVTALAALCGCLACAGAARRQSGAKRRFWTILTVALGAWTFAEVIWAVYDMVLHTSVPVPSWADVGYLGAIPLAAGRCSVTRDCSWPDATGSRESLDALAVGFALVFLSWTFVLGSLWRHTDLTTAGGIVALAYPFGDLVIIFLIIGAVRSVATAGRRPLLWVLGGLFAMAVSDSTYAYLVEAGHYSTGSLIDTGWVVAYLAIAVGATCDAGATVYAAEEAVEATLASFVTPYVPVILALSVITVKLELHQKVDRVSWLTGFGSGPSRHRATGGAAHGPSPGAVPLPHGPSASRCRKPATPPVPSDRRSCLRQVPGPSS